ncbi:MAG TPA: amidohydrolase family protein, partial [Candidatus Hungatella pullicola]|nr:amidohydrolase family protein [Candidatus Hungatella pullicola]
MLRGKESFILKGDICYSKNPHQLEFVEQGYVVCLEGKCQGVYSLLPEVFQDLPLEDAGNCLIVPGLTDLHIHGPQYGFRGIGMDLELLDWLNQRTFPQEAKYEKKEYARQAYGIFADSLKESGTTRACIFGTIHVDSTLILMDLMEKTGLITMVGKVNMDRNSPDYLREQSAQESAD